MEVTEVADTTTTSSPTARAGHVGADAAGLTNPANKAPADQPGYDPKDSKWASVPGAAARANNYPRLS
jgi:hypothetical protein